MARSTEMARTAVLDGLRAGLTMHAVAARAGVSRSTVHAWIDRGRRARTGRHRAFADAVEDARGEAEAVAVEAIRNAMADDWRAGVGYLERTNPAEWSITPCTSVRTAK